MSGYTYDKDKMPSIHPELGKFDFVTAKYKREEAYAKGIGSKEWIEFATMMFEQFPFIYNTCLLMNDEAASMREQIRSSTDAMNGVIEWDKSRGFIVPYKVRDPIQQALAQIKDLEK